MANNIPIVLLQQAQQTQQPQQAQQAQQPQADTQNSGTFSSLFSDVSQLFANASNYFKQNAAAANTPQTIIMTQGGGSIFGNCGCSCGNNLFGINYHDDALYDYFSVGTQRSSSPAIGYTSTSARARIFNADDINKRVQEALDSVAEADAAAAAAKQQQATGTTPTAGTTTPTTTTATTSATTPQAQTQAETKPAEEKASKGTDTTENLNKQIEAILDSSVSNEIKKQQLSGLIPNFADNPESMQILYEEINKLGASA